MPPATTSPGLIIASLTRFVERVVRKIVLDVVANLASAPTTGYGTPVDTGWARSNWLVNIGGPVSSAAGSKSAVAPLPNPLGILGSYRLTHGRVYITNNVPYIGLLNNPGTSPQANAHFVNRAIDKAIVSDLQVVA